MLEAVCSSPHLELQGVNTLNTRVCTFQSDEFHRAIYWVWDFT